MLAAIDGDRSICNVETSLIVLAGNSIVCSALDVVLPMMAATSGIASGPIGTLSRTASTALSDFTRSVTVSVPSVCTSIGQPTTVELLALIVIVCVIESA